MKKNIDWTPSAELKPQIQVIDKIATYLYNDGNPRSGNLYELLKKNGFKFKNEVEKNRFIDTYLVEGWFYLDMETGETHLTEIGIRYCEEEEEISYEKTLAVSHALAWSDLRKKIIKSKTKRQRSRFKYVIRNTSSIVAIILSLSTVLVTIISIFEKRELRSLEQEVKQLREGQDTLIQKLNLAQKPQDSIQVEDTLQE